MATQNSSEKKTTRKTDERIKPNQSYIVRRFGIIFAITAILAVAIAVSHTHTQRE